MTVLFQLGSKLYVALLQVPHAGQLFREISKSRKVVNNADERSCNGLHNLVNTSHSSIRKFLKLKWRKFDHLAYQIGGAENIFCELFGHHKAENTFWLDSSSIEKVCLFLNDVSLQLKIAEICIIAAFSCSNICEHLTLVSDTKSAKNA